MNIDAESIALLSLVLRYAPQDSQFILCILARSNQVPSPIKLDSNTEYPTFYGYFNERIPYYLMGKGIISNVPREGSAKRLITSHYLSYAETVINGAKNWDIHQKLMSVSKFITLDNKTTYKDAEVFLVFRDKAQDYIEDYVNQNRGQISGFLKSKLGRFEFGNKLLNQKEELPEEKNGIGTPQSKKGLEKKWDVLQAIWTVYDSNSRADSVLVPIASLAIKDRHVEEIDGIIEGLKNNGCFTRWERKDRWYNLEFIDHEKLPKTYMEVGNAYKKLVAYEEQDKNDETIKVQRQGLPIMLTKKELRKRLTDIMHTKKFGKKEKAFLQFLAKDFEPKTIEQTSKEVDTKACTKLKASVQKKLKGTGFNIKTDKGGWGRKAIYQLEYLLSSENS